MGVVMVVYVRSDVGISGHKNTRTVSFNTSSNSQTFIYRVAVRRLEGPANCLYI